MDANIIANQCSRCFHIAPLLYDGKCTRQKFGGTCHVTRTHRRRHYKTNLAQAANCLYDGCIYAQMPLVSCNGCKARNTHHVCQNEHEMNLWKAAHPSETWPPQDAVGKVNNEFEEVEWYCHPCHPTKKANASTPATTTGTANTSTAAATATANALTAATTANAASTGEVIDVDDPSNALLVTPPNKRSAGSALDLLVQAGPKSKKPKDDLLHSCFIITPSVGEGLEGTGRVDACCKYCPTFSNKGVLKFNSTRGRTHSLLCRGTPENVKDRLRKTSQTAKREGMAAVYHCTSMNTKGIRSTGLMLASESMNMKGGTAVSK